MFKIGRGMSRDVQTKLVNAKKKYFQEILFPFESFQKFLGCILSQTTPS